MLGIIGALDPHTHKLNQADLQGEGKLEEEGVRPQRPPQYNPAGPGEAKTLGYFFLSFSQLSLGIEACFPEMTLVFSHKVVSINS